MLSTAYSPRVTRARAAASSCASSALLARGLAEDRAAASSDKAWTVCLLGTVGLALGGVDDVDGGLEGVGVDDDALVGVVAADEENVVGAA